MKTLLRTGIAEMTDAAEHHRSGTGLAVPDVSNQALMENGLGRP